MSLKRKVWLGFVMVLVCFLVGVWSLVFLLPDSKLHIKFYYVGQGDSIFIRTPKGYRILVDGGPNNKVVDYLDGDLPIWDRRIDLIVLTHPQADHLFGLIEVLRRFKVGKVIVSGVENNSTSTFKLWKKILLDQKIKLEIVSESSSLSILDSVKFDILWPTEEFPNVSDLNEAGIVMRISYGNFDTLLTADADQKVQPYQGNLSSIEVLKVPHHGSKTAMSESFLTAVSPQVAVISVGRKNNYGHPSEQTLNQLKRHKTKIFRTDQNGTVEIVSDGEGWYTRTNK